MEHLSATHLTRRHRFPLPIASASLSTTGATTQDFRDLLDPEGERDVKDGDNSDQAIFEAVMARHGEGAAQDDDEGEIDPRPSPAEALAAASTLIRFVMEIDEPFARKLEQLLLTLGRHAQNMVDTQIAGIKTRAEGHDGTQGEGRGRPRVAATDDQEQGREEGGTREGNTDGTDTG